MASGHVNRIKRPNTWLHRPMLQNVKKALANSEPSTHGTDWTSSDVRSSVAIGGKPDKGGKPILGAIDPERTWVHWSVLVLLLAVKTGKAPTVPTHTATLNRSVLG
jgi:hypothetical protein